MNVLFKNPKKTAKLVVSLFSSIPTIFNKSDQPLSDHLGLFMRLSMINLGARLPVYGSADITNKCNLKCKHCYWWKNRKPAPELSAAQWSGIIDDVFLKNGVFQVALTGGEPLLRPDVIDVFSRKMPKKFVVVSNGTLELNRIKGMLAYYVSIDGTRDVHDRIRGRGVYERVKKNVSNCDERISINMTINSMNCSCLEDVAKEWSGIVNTLNFQFHTPFEKDDRLWIPYGRARDKIVDRIKALKGEYPGLLLNTDMQLENLKGNSWVGKCPSWSILSLDGEGKRKLPCCIGGEKKPMCERCGMCEYAGMHSAIYGIDTEWIDLFNKNVFREKPDKSVADREP